MKKKIKWFVGVIVLVAIAIGCAYAVDMHRMKNYEPVIFSSWGKELSAQDAAEIVKNNLGRRTIKTITNLDNPIIEEMMVEEIDQTRARLFDKNRDDTGRTVYRVKFHTFEDGLLGPIVIYVDKKTGRLVAGEYRE